MDDLILNRSLVIIKNSKPDESKKTKHKDPSEKLAHTLSGSVIVLAS